ncbi:S4 domain-containing protein, partial [Bacillus thuringiensis]
MSEVVQVTVAEEQKNERIDKFVAEINSEWSRSQVQQWIKDDVVTVNGKSVKVNYKVKENDEITVTIPEPEALDIQAEDMNLEIYYEDADVLVVNKPRGMVVHPAPGHTSGTL